MRRLVTYLSTLVTLAIVGILWASQPLEASGKPVQQGWNPAGAATPVSMTLDYEMRCASCHDNRSPDNRAPSRETLRQLPPERVLAAVTTGPMGEFVAGLREEQLSALAELVTGKPFGGAADRAATAMSNPCAGPLSLDDPFERPHWNGWAPDPTRSHRFQDNAAAGLTGAQVPDLKLKWAFALPGAASAAWAQPTIVGDALFIGSDNNFVYALDAKSGCVHWSYEAPGQVRTAVSIGALSDVPGVRYAAAFGDYMGYVTAVNAETGEQLWSVRPDDHPAAKITGPPVLDPSPGGHLYVGVSSWAQIPAARVTYECCTFQGSVSALDLATGERIWKTYTMSERPRPLRQNSAGTQLYGPSGAAVWNAPTLDLEHRTLYSTTGTCYISEFFDDPIGFDDGTCVSVMAFNLDTGARLWWTQLVPNDRHGGGCGTTAEERRLNCPGFVDDPDDDPSGSPLLVRLADGRRAIIQGQESGRVTALDPDNRGAVLWVSQAADRMSPSDAGFGGAYDGEYYFKPQPHANGTGSIAALRPEDGSRAWYTELAKPTDCENPEETMTCHSGNWAAASAITGAVFTGSRSGVLRSYSTEDGGIVWEFDTAREFDTVNGVAGFGGGFGGAAPSIVDGMLYVGSGYAILGNAPGNVILAFGLD